MIQLHQVSKRYGQRSVVKSLSLNIKAGEFVVLIGPSGCGKSTTLKMMNRLIEYDEGQIVYQGKDIQQMSVTDLRLNTGYVIQSIGLFPHWNVARNIATVLHLLHWSDEQIHVRVDELMHTFNLTPVERFRHQYPHQLSGGQAQRVGVARALAADAPVLLMDEPFGALDPITRLELQRELRRIQQATGKTIVFVTHDMDEALAMADKIAIMKEGALVQYGSPLDILIKPENDFVARFIGQSDLGLKLLSQRHVGQYISTAQLQAAAEGHHWQTDKTGRPLRLIGGKLNQNKRQAMTEVNEAWQAKISMSMKEALSRMVWYRVSVLPVVNEQGILQGEVSLKAMMEPPHEQN